MAAAWPWLPFPFMQTARERARRCSPVGFLEFDEQLPGESSAATIPGGCSRARGFFPSVLCPQSWGEALCALVLLSSSWQAGG